MAAIPARDRSFRLRTLRAIAAGKPVSLERRKRLARVETATALKRNPPLTGAERQRLYRARKRIAAGAPRLSDFATVAKGEHRKRQRAAIKAARPRKRSRSPMQAAKAIATAYGQWVSFDAAPAVGTWIRKSRPGRPGSARALSTITKDPDHAVPVPPADDLPPIVSLPIGYIANLRALLVYRSAYGTIQQLKWSSLSAMTPHADLLIADATKKLRREPPSNPGLGVADGVMAISVQVSPRSSKHIKL